MAPHIYDIDDMVVHAVKADDGLSAHCHGPHKIIGIKEKKDGTYLYLLFGGTWVREEDLYPNVRDAAEFSWPMVFP